MASVVIVGGGIAGLVVARDLVLGGMTVTLLEASDHLGGKVARHTVAGIELDAGAESFATRRGTVAELARQLGLESAIVPPSPDGAWLQTVAGSAFPLPKTGILGIPGTPMASDVIEVIGFWAALRAQLDELMLGFVGAKEKSLGRLVRRRMGDAVLERLVAPVTLGIHSKHPDDLDVDVVAPGLRTALLRTGSLSHAVRQLREAAPAGSAVAGISGGMFELVEALRRDLDRFGVTVRLSTPVTSVDSSGATVADGERFDADHVVLATSLGRSEQASIVLATLVVDAPELDSAPRGTGVLVAAGTPGIRAKALTHATAKWRWLADNVGASRHVLRLSYNQAPVDGLRELAIEDARQLLGVPLNAASIIGFDRVEWAAPAAAPDVVSGVTAVGEGVSGTGLAAVVRHARNEAERLLKDIDG
ncbi:MAG: protoporphyrinogen/coproporphyrinogen oxidase [Microbacteriaceae bacterium]|jgi:oxygen-dependent protoporphyrinogen oxidase|nr:protoporphyrinogen/coproporphyrinogen oxidase [Microbacteriaceae bacterium]